MQHIASVQLPQELIASKSDKDEERTSLVMKSVLEQLQDFLRPLLQEVSIQTSSLEKVVCQSALRELKVLKLLEPTIKLFWPRNYLCLFYSLVWSECLFGWGVNAPPPAW